MGKLTDTTQEVQNLLDKIADYPQEFNSKNVTSAVDIDGETIKRTESGTLYVDTSVFGGSEGGNESDFDAAEAYSQLSERVAEDAARISALEQEVLGGYVSPTIITGNAQGEGGYSSTARWKMFTGLEAGLIMRIKITADTEVAYSSADNEEHTFVDVVYYPAGTTTPTNIVWENRGNVGDTYPAGATIYEGEYTLPEAADIWLRGRFVGNVTLQVEYGGEYGSGLKGDFEELKATTDNHEVRIKTLEAGTTSDIISQYKYQIGRALQLGYVESRSAAGWPISPLVFAHVSDTHKATNNTRAFEVLNYLAANGHVQFLMHTGDILEDPKNASQSRWASIVAAAQYPVMLTPGNHDVGNWATAEGQYTTSIQFHNTFIVPVLNGWGLKSDGSGTPYTSGKNYYFKDFTEQKVRFIVVDEYELPDQFSSDGTTLLAGRGARWISQAQANWFVDALQTTPEGYGVVVAKHAPDGKRGEDNNPFNSPFLKGKEHQQTYQYFGGVSYTTFFADIVQAFIDKTTLSKTIQQSAGTITGSVTITADFSTTAGREFICYVTGHTHADGISFLKDYPEQLDLNINCNNTFYQHYSDLYLAEGTMYEDAINVYSIDRNRGVIHVVRIGGEYSADGDRRDIMTIDYRNSQAATDDFDAEGAYNSLSSKVSTNTTNITSLSSRVTTAETNITSNANRISALENETPTPDVPTTTLTGEAVGEGGYSNTARWKIATGLAAGLAVTIRVTATTAVEYSSADNAEHTFVDVVYYPTGTTTPTNVIWENRGNVGDSYTAGEIINEFDYTIPEDADIWLRGRFLGTVKVEIIYSE